MNTIIRNQHPSTWLIGLLAALAVTACGGGGGSAGSGTNASGTTATVATPLTVSATAPIDKSTGIALKTAVSATFNVKVEPVTIISPARAFTVKESLTGNEVPGSVAMDATGATAIFTPKANLAANTQYVGTITTAAKNADGSTLARDYTWNFTTTSPSVEFTSPASAAAAAPVNSKVAAAFTTDMNAATFTAASFTVKPAAGGAALAGTISYDDKSRTAIFAPAANLQAGTAYIATLTTDVKDMRGNALGTTTSWTFATAAALDATAPTVTLFEPGHEVKGVPLKSQIKTTFSETMDPATVTKSNLHIADPAGIDLSGTLKFESNTNVATFTPDQLAPNTRYHIVANSFIKDLAGNALVEEVSFFETGAN